MIYRIYFYEMVDSVNVMRTKISYDNLDVLKQHYGKNLIFITNIDGTPIDKITKTVV